MFPEFQTVNMSQSKQCVICNIDFSRKDCLIRHMKSKHANKEVTNHYNMPMMTSENDGMQQSDDTPTEDSDTIVLHRPIVEDCLEKFKELKRKYVDLERANISLQAKIKASEDVESSEDETSVPEESQSGDESVETESGRKKPGSTHLTKIVPELNRLKVMHPSNQKTFIDTCHNDLIRCVCYCTRHIINGKAKLTPDELKQLRRRKQMVRRLARKNTSLKNKRKILQTGGFLQLILPPILGLLSSILNKQ